MNEAEIAWSAGLFEGEGTIAIAPGGVRSRQRNTAVRLVVVMTDRDVIERLARTVGCGTVNRRRPPSAATHHKTQWRWQISRRPDCQRILRQWLPLLGERRAARACEALAALEDTETWDRICPRCGDPFIAEREDKRFCSERCRRSAAHHDRYRHRKTRTKTECMSV